MRRGTRDSHQEPPVRAIEMLHRIPDLMGSGTKGERRIVVIYENPSVREHTLSPAAQLEAQSIGNADLDIHWCSFTMLEDPDRADEAARKAERADLVVFAVGPAGDLAQQIKTWIEGWICRRCEREGAIIGLVDQQAWSGELASLKEIYLRHSAHRAGMDYLSHLPGSIAKAIPDSLDSYSDRAERVTHVLDEILHTRFQPPSIRE